MYYVYEFEAWGERELVEFLHDHTGEDIDALQAYGFSELVGMAYEVHCGAVAV